MAIPTNRDSDKFVLRLPEGMRDRIKAAADQNNRSMNAEIVATLEEKYPAPVDHLPPDMRLLADYLGLVDSAQDAKERAEFLASVNEAMRADPALSSLRIGCIEDPQLPGVFSAYVTRAKD